MKVLVTGGAGFIGSHLIEALVERGDEVTVLDDFSVGKMENLRGVYGFGYDLGVVEGSVCNLSTVLPLVAEKDIIFHLATQCLVKGLEDPKLMHEVNDVGTFNVLLAAKEYNNKVVYIGTSEEYGPQEKFPIKEDAPMKPVSIYGLTKLIAERYVEFFHEIYGVPAVIIRPFNTFGPRQREDAYAGVITSFVKRIRANKQPIIFGDGLQTRDFTYVSDIVDGILVLSELKDCEIVNLGSGGDVPILKLADLVFETVAFKLHKTLHASVIFDKPRPNDIRILRADISLARSYGYNPKVSFREGLKKYVGWYNKSSHNR